MQQGNRCAASSSFTATPFVYCYVIFWNGGLDEQSHPVGGTINIASSKAFLFAMFADPFKTATNNDHVQTDD